MHDHWIVRGRASKPFGGSSDESCEIDPREFVSACVHEDFREIQDKIRSDPSKELVYAYPVFPGIRKGTSELQPRAECIEKIEQLLKKCRQNGGKPKQIAMCMNKTLNKEY